MNSVVTADDLHVGHQPRSLTWEGEPLSSFTCLLSELRERLPRVERRPFALTSADGDPRPENPYRDLIVGVAPGGSPVPLGVVSKRYQLVQYADLVDSVIQALKIKSLHCETLRTDVRLTELGSRLHFSVHVPDRGITIGDDHLDLTVECFNSVDRSRAFYVGMGWIRPVCGNGLFVGRLTASMRQSHVPSLRLQDITAVIAKGFEAADADAVSWQNNAKITVVDNTLDAWIDDAVTKKWGVASAARVAHIARSGWDGRPREPRAKLPASQRTLASTAAVPGSEPPNDNVFRIGQVLAWVANTPSEWGARLERRRDIPSLLAPLVRAAGQVAKSKTTDDIETKGAAN